MLTYLRSNDTGNCTRLREAQTNRKLCRLLHVGGTLRYVGQEPDLQRALTLIVHHQSKELAYGKII
jgi:hypothetical protein